MKNFRATLLLVEDDENLGFVLTDFLTLSDYYVVWKKNGQQGLKAFNESSFDMVLLDVMMPVKDGFTLAEEIRNRNASIPIIFLTAKSLKEDKIKGFKLGADDYITKPFSTEELSYRIEAVLRRLKVSDMPENSIEPITFGGFTFYPNDRLLLAEGFNKRLTRRETSVLRLLSSHKNILVKREIILKTVWGRDDYFTGRSMDVYITKLRKYLSYDPKVVIINFHSNGFKLVDEDASAETDSMTVKE